MGLVKVNDTVIENKRHKAECPVMLTEQQHCFFETFGFVLLHQLFTAAEMQALAAVADAR